MLNIFPNLLLYGILAPTILRLLVGAIFLEFGYSKLNKENPAKIKALEKLGVNGKVVFKILGILESLIGISLIFGFLTQISALLGALIMLGAMYLKKQSPDSSVYPKIYFFVLFIILVSLMITGAGALAFDSRL